MMITVIGLGEIGEPTFKKIAEKVGKNNVCGIEINEEKIKKIKSEGYIVKTVSEIPSNVYIICLSTPVEDINNLLEVLKMNIKYVKKPLISFESTIPPTKISEIIVFLNEIGRDSYDLVFFPHRYFKPDSEHQVFNLNRVIAGINEESLNRGINFYLQFMSKKLIHPVSNLEIAALCKTIENGYRYIEIAFSEELKMLCDKKGIDFEELRKAINTKWNINIKEARDGIKGHCLSKDTNFFNSFFNNESVFASLAKQVDKEYKEKIRNLFKS